MQIGVLTVGTTPVRVPVQTALGVPNGLRMLARAANSGAVYVGTTSGVTASTGNLLPKGAPETSVPYTVPKDHFAGNEVWLVADGAGQLVDWAAG